jgi:hypothetical protein
VISATVTWKAISTNTVKQVLLAIAGFGHPTHYPRALAYMPPPPAVPARFQRRGIHQVHHPARNLEIYALRSVAILPP